MGNVKEIEQQGSTEKHARHSKNTQRKKDIQKTRSRMKKFKKHARMIHDSMIQEDVIYYITLFLYVRFLSFSCTPSSLSWFSLVVFSSLSLVSLSLSSPSLSWFSPFSFSLFSLFLIFLSLSLPRSLSAGVYVRPVLVFSLCWGDCYS